MHAHAWPLVVACSLLFAAPVGAQVVDKAGAERDVNATYQRTMTKLDADARRKLQAAELAWIRYKDLNVDFHRAWLGGAAAERHYVAMTNERTEYLGLAYMICGQVPAGFDTYLSDRPYAAADRALNTAYGALVPKLDPASRKKLLAAQLAWIKFRDAEVAFWKTWSRFSMRRDDMRETCLATMTELRTEELRKLAN